MIIGLTLIFFKKLEGIPLVSISVATTAQSLFDRKGWSDYLDKTLNVKKPILLVIFAVTFGSIGLATYNALSIIHGKESGSVATKPANLINDNTSMLGEAGSIVFFWEHGTKRIIQIKRDDIDVLVKSK